MQQSLALTALALAVAIAVSHAGVVMGDDTWDDVRYHTEIAPPRLAAATQIARADVPAWWDGAGFGVPLLAEPAHGALAPTTWLAHTPRALDALLVLHLWWAALGVAAWARRRGASELAGLGAGLLVATSGMFASAAIRGALPALAMLPWLGVAATALREAGERSSRALAALGVGAALGAIALAGQLAVLADALVLVLAVAGARDRASWLAAAIAAGLAIGCAQWIPAVMQLPGEAGARVTGLPLARFVEVVAPGRFARDGAWFPSVFVGAALFALARLRVREVAALGALGAFALIAGRGGWPAWAGAPELHLAAAVAIVAACAANGLDGALAGDGRAARALLVGAGITAVAAFAAAFTQPESAAARDGAVAVVCLALAAFVAWRERGSWAAPVVLALIIAPSVTALPDVAPTASRASTDAPSAWATSALAAMPGHAPVRVYRPEPFVLTANIKVLDLEDSIATLAGESAAPWGLANARGTDPARDPGVERVWNAAAAGGGVLLDCFGVAIAILPTVVVDARHMYPLGQLGGQTLAQLPVKPVASVMHGWSWVVAPADALSLMFLPDGHAGIPSGTIVLRGTGDSHADPGKPVPCAIDDWRDGDIALTCDGGAAPGYAAVTSTPARGWAVRVDDASADWWTADLLRRAVAIAPGPHRVRWTYAAPGFALGAGLAGLGLLALGALGWVARRGRVRA